MTTLFHGCIGIIAQIIQGVVGLFDRVYIAPGVTMWNFSLALILVSAFIGVFFVIAKH